MKRFRCTGAIHGEVGDCLRPIAGGLFCYGYLDRDQGVPLTSSMEGPVPMLFPVCSVHRVALVDWAQHLWGGVADAMFVPPEAIPRLLVLMKAEDETVVLAPDPNQAVGIFASGA